MSNFFYPTLIPSPNQHRISWPSSFVFLTPGKCGRLQDCKCIYATSYARRNRSNGSSSAFYSNQRLTPGRLPKKKPDALCSNPNAICFGPSFADVVAHCPAHRRWLPNILWFLCCGVNPKLRHCSLFLSRHRLLRPLLRLHHLLLAPSPFIFPQTQVRLGSLGDAATADCVSCTPVAESGLS